METFEVQNLPIKRKNNPANWPFSRAQSFERLSTSLNTSSVLIMGWGMVSFVIVKAAGAEDWVSHHRDLVRALDVNRKNSQGDPLYNIPRGKTKNNDRARHNFLIEQISQKLIYLTTRLPSIVSTYEPTKLNNAPRKYVPSDEMVSIVRESVLKRKHELESLLPSGEFNLEDSSIDALVNQSERFSESNEAIRAYIVESILGFLATIGQGLAHGNSESLRLSKDGELLDIVLGGFRHRIPVMLKDSVIFSKQLYRDLTGAAREHVLKNEFSEVVIKDHELVLQRLKTVTPIQGSNRNRKRAKVSMLG